MTKSLQVEFDTEAWHWVPREAVAAAVAALGRAAPQLPAAPVLALLARLNKVWRQREAEAVREAKAQAQRSAAEAARASENAKPWQQAVAAQKLARTQQQLKRSRAACCSRFHTHFARVRLPRALAWTMRCFTCDLTRRRAPNSL